MKVARDVGIDEHLPQRCDRLQEACSGVHRRHPRRRPRATAPAERPAPSAGSDGSRAVGSRRQDLVHQAFGVVLGEHEDVEMAKRLRCGQLGFDVAPGDGVQPGMRDRDREQAGRPCPPAELVDARTRRPRPSRAGRRAARCRRARRRSGWGGRTSAPAAERPRCARSRRRSARIRQRFDGVRLRRDRQQDVGGEQELAAGIDDRRGVGGHDRHRSCRPKARFSLGFMAADPDALREEDRPEDLGRVALVRRLQPCGCHRQSIGEVGIAGTGTLDLLGHHRSGRDDRGPPGRPVHRPVVRQGGRSPARRPDVRARRVR